jgi:hypothetical protein
MMATQKLYELLEKNDNRFEPICGLYSWSENFDGQNPFAVFLDLIGYSNERFGSSLTTWAGLESVLGYVELDYLADALKMYAVKPADVRDFIDLIISAEV